MKEECPAELTWEEVLKREGSESLTGGEIESQEDGVVYRGPIESIFLREKYLFINTFWMARSKKTGGWERHEFQSINLYANSSPPKNSENDRITFDTPPSNNFSSESSSVIFPRGEKNKLSPFKVNGLDLKRKISTLLKYPGYFRASRGYFMKIVLFVVFFAILTTGVFLVGRWWDKHYWDKHRTVGIIKKVCWECWSVNHVYGIDDVSTTAELERTTSGRGRTARCFTAGKTNFAHNDFQRVTFYIILDTPMGKRMAEYSWRRNHSSQEEFELPAKNLPPDGSKIDIITTLSGSIAKGVGF